MIQEAMQFRQETEIQQKDGTLLQQRQLYT